MALSLVPCCLSVGLLCHPLKQLFPTFTKNYAFHHPARHCFCDFSRHLFCPGCKYQTLLSPAHDSFSHLFLFIACSLCFASSASAYALLHMFSFLSFLFFRHFVSNPLGLASFSNEIHVLSCFFHNNTLATCTTRPSSQSPPLVSRTPQYTFLL